LLDTLHLIDQVQGAQPVIAFAPDWAEAYFRESAPARFRLVPQQGDDLGQRLNHVLRQHLQDGYAQAVVMNSDGPTLPLDYLKGAFARLDDPAVDVVLGPSEDGGYYLIGLKEPCRALFDVTMSTPSVLEETLALADGAGLAVECLSPWHDVDVWEDIARLSQDLANLPDTDAAHTRRFLAKLDIK